MDHAKDAENTALPPIQVACDNCGADLLAEDRDAGRQANCPDCGATLTIPSPMDQELRQEIEELPEPPSEDKPKQKLQLKDEVDLETPDPDTKEDESQGTAAQTSQPMHGQDIIPDGHVTRAKLSGWLRRVILVVLALGIIQVFDTMLAAIRMSPPMTLSDMVRAIGGSIAGLPSTLYLLGERRVLGSIGVFTPLERFAVSVIILVFIARLVVRSKLLDTIYVTTFRWAERTHGGLVYHFLALLLQIGLLIWAASIAKLEAGTDGMACVLLAAYLFTSAVWLMSLHLVSTHEHRDLPAWAIVDGLFGIAVLLVVLWPGLTILWSRAGATVIVCLINSSIALHFGASFIFARRAPGWWWRKPLFLIASCVIVFLAALLLAIIR